MTSTTLVTGATGFLGTHLLERLLSPETVEAGGRLRVLSTRERPELESRGAELVVGSVLDEDVVREAVSGVNRLYHLAGRVSRDPDDARELYRLHVEGTSRLCRAAKTAGVERIVLASTSGTIAVTSDGESVPDETWPTPLELIGKWPYYTSKLYQEVTAERECADGPELVILNPSLLLGPGDARLSSSEDVMKFLAGELPVIPPGGINFVDVRDVADAFVAAMARARSGERYLLGGPNWTFEVFFRRLERLSKVKGPRVKLPRAVFAFGAQAVDAIYRQLDQVPPLDRVSSEMAQRFWYCDSSKAESELGFVARDPYETLYETVAYLRETVLGDGILS